MKIRKAKKEDLSSIAEIYRIESAKKPYNTKFNSSSALKEIIECFKEDIYLAEKKNRIVGFIALHIVKSNKKVVYIDEFWIKYNYQGKGIGRQLLNIVEKKYKKNGIKIVRFTTNRKAKSCGFYKKLNYKESEELIYFDKKL